MADILTSLIEQTNKIRLEINERGQNYKESLLMKINM